MFKAAAAQALAASVCARVWHLPAHDVPEKAGEFADDDDAHQFGVLAGARHAAIAPAQAYLCLPGDAFGLRRGIHRFGFEMLGLARRVAIAPCRFDQHAPGMGVAGKRDRALASTPAHGVLAGHQPEEGHQLLRRLKAAVWSN